MLEDGGDDVRVFDACNRSEFAAALGASLYVNGDKWVQEIGLDPSECGTHSLRRTKPTLIYQQTKNLRAVQLLLGHTKLESTIRYLGVEMEDALAIAEDIEI